MGLLGVFPEMKFMKVLDAFPNARLSISLNSGCTEIVFLTYKLLFIIAKNRTILSAMCLIFNC